MKASKRRRIAIISDYFAPANSIAAIRPTKVAKYFKKDWDCEIVVVTRRPSPGIRDEAIARDLSAVDRFVEVTEGPFFAWLNRKRAERTARRRTASGAVGRGPVHVEGPPFDAENAKMALRYVLQYLSSVSYHRQAMKAWKAAGGGVDVVFSSYDPFSSHLIGRSLKRLEPKAIWIADFRDPVLDTSTPLGLRSFFRGFARRVCRRADVLTAVSQGCMDRLFFDEHPSRRIVPNGYDRDDLEGIPMQDPRAERLRLVYAGAMYKRDLTPVFRAVAELVCEGRIRRDGIEFAYAGQAEGPFLRQAQASGLADRVRIHGYLPRKEALALQLQADLLLLAAWNRTDSTGVVTGKFLEYLMMGKPIVCTIEGDLPGSILKQLIEAARVGFCHEQVDGEAGFAMLKDYLADRFADFENGRAIAFDPDTAFIDGFDYRNIAKHLETLVQEAETRT